MRSNVIRVIRLLYLWLRWQFFDTEPYAVTLEAYEHKLQVDAYRKKCEQPPLKDRIKDYRRIGKKIEYPCFGCGRLRKKCICKELKKN